MEDYSIIQAQTMLVARFSCLLCVVSSFAHAIHSQCEALASIDRRETWRSRSGVSLLERRRFAQMRWIYESESLFSIAVLARGNYAENSRIR
jgi:hypothetical protein